MNGHGKLNSKLETLLDTTFICPYMKIRLEVSCNVISCPYHTINVESHCIWEYICSKKSVSITELALILNKDKKELTDILRRVKFKLIKKMIKRKITSLNFSLNYCTYCGRAYDLIQKVGTYVCRTNCSKINNYKDLEDLYNKPISYILIVYSSLMNIGTMAELLQKSNANIKDMYIKVFGDDSLLARNKDLKETKFRKRNKKLTICYPLIRKVRIKSWTFSTIRRKIRTFFN